MHTISATAGKEELIISIEQVVSALDDLITSIDEKEINTIPYQGSWTAGQLIRHVTKSINGMAKAMQLDAVATDRPPGERIPELQKVFLDFSSKLQSPEVIIPENRLYQKEEVLNELTQCLAQLIHSVHAADLSGLVEGLPLGPITKLEMLHFVLYHTQRHLQQLQRIHTGLKSQ